MKAAALLIVGYTTKQRDDAGNFMPEFSAPKNYGPEKAAEYIANKREEFLKSCDTQPYVGQFSSYTALIVRSGFRQVFKSETGEPNSLHVTIAKELGMFFNHGQLLGDPVRVFGFNVRAFVKILALLGAEKKLPALPSDLWYGSDHRDVTAAMVPDGFSLIDYRVALRRLFPEINWTGYAPGVDANTDAFVSAKVALALGLFPQHEVDLSHGLQQLGQEAPHALKAYERVVPAKPVADLKEFEEEKPDLAPKKPKLPLPVKK